MSVEEETNCVVGAVLSVEEETFVELLCSRWRRRLLLRRFVGGGGGDFYRGPVLSVEEETYCVVEAELELL